MDGLMFVRGVIILAILAVPGDEVDAKCHCPVYTQCSCAKNTFEEEALLAHNTARQRHQAPPLKLSTTLSKMASDVASRAARGLHIRSSSTRKAANNIGESLCMACGYPYFGGEDVTLEWYRQACNYDFTTHKKIPAHKGEIENFRRMVWRDAREFGIGKAKSEQGNDCTYIAAWYRPIRGEAQANVFRGEFFGDECPRPPGVKRPSGRRGQYLDGKAKGRGSGIFLCGKSAQVLRKKACKLFGFGCRKTRKN